MKRGAGQIAELPNSFTIRSLLRPQILTVPIATTVEQATATIRRSNDRSQIFYVYVTDSAGTLCGVVSIRSLLLAEPDQSLNELYSAKIVSLRDSLPVREAFRVFSQSRFLSLPVVDSEGKPLGVVHAHELADEFEKGAQGILEERNRGQLFELLGIKAEELSLTPVTIARHRIPWLCINIAGGLISASFVHSLTQDLTGAVLFLAFLPVLLIVTESIGMQTAYVVIGNLHRSAGRVRFGQVFRKEAFAALLTGLFCGLVVAAFAWFWDGNSSLIRTISVALPLGALLVAFLATLVPQLLHRFRLDPNIAAGPIVLALADSLVLLLYLGLALFFSESFTF